MTRSSSKKEEQRFVQLKNIIGLCSVVATEKAPHSVLLYVQLKKGGENGFMSLEVRLPGYQSQAITTRDEARFVRDRVLLAMGSGGSVIVQTGNGAYDWESLNPSREFGWKPALPKKLRVRATRLTA